MYVKDKNQEARACLSDDEVIWIGWDRDSESETTSEPLVFDGNESNW